jgi:hypothetical protein
MLKKIAPSVVFDGDGPDPRDEGFIPYDITVEAITIVDGELWQESVFLGGSYMKPEDFDIDIHGYLPQMLQEAARNLSEKYVAAWSERTEKELAAAVAYLTKVMKERYDREERRREIDRGGG